MDEPKRAEAHERRRNARERGVLVGRARRGLCSLEFGDSLGDALFIGHESPAARSARTFAAYLARPLELLESCADLGDADAELLRERRKAQSVARGAQQFLDPRRLGLTRAPAPRSRRRRGCTLVHALRSRAT